MSQSKFKLLAAAAIVIAAALASCKKVSLGAIEDRLDKVERAVDSLSGVRTGVQVLSDKMNTLAADVAVLKEQVARSSDADASRLSALETAVDELRARAVELAGLVPALESIGAILAGHTDSLATLDASVTGIDVALSALQTKVSALEAALEAAASNPESGAAVAAVILRVDALEPAVDTLTAKVAELEEALSALTDRVDSVVLVLAGIDGQIEAITSSIAQMNAAIEDLKSSTDASSAEVQAAIAALEARIKALEDLKESLATKDWVNATFATLEAQMATAADLAAVQALLTGLPEGKTVSETIDSVSAGVRGWVNDTLSAYWTAGVIEGKLAVMKAGLDSLGSASSDSIINLKASIAALETALATAGTEIEAAYKAAIAAAADSLGVKITANTEAITTANGKISALETDVTSLTARMDAVEGDISDLKDFADSMRRMVQSAVFVPKYKGGSAVVTSFAELDSLVLDYKVLPRKAGKAIAESWSGDKSILDVNYRQVSTRASGVQTLEIKDVAFDATDSLLHVAVSLSEVSGILLSEDKALAVSLEINTGATMVSSPYTDIDNTLEYVDLNTGGKTANCYIVKEGGLYKFDATVRGNGKDTDGNDADAITGVTSAEVLWESFGNSDTPAAGDLVKNVILEDGYVKFTATSGKGNAVIAVKNGEEILWSWHIWLTDEPQAQVYNNDAGTMMDRNLGATSATPSDGVKTFGLLYQWGRKDPFLGSSAIDANILAKSTLSWPAPKSVTDGCIPDGGTNSLAYSIAHPTEFITNSLTPCDWYCTASADQNNYLWKNSTGSAKTMYDPCPVGWRVPDGGSAANGGVWSKAGFFSSTGSWDSGNKGMSFSVLQSVGTTWYPAAGYRNGSSGALDSVGSDGGYWSCTVDDTDACSLGFDSNGGVGPSDDTLPCERLCGPLPLRIKLNL